MPRGDLRTFVVIDRLVQFTLYGDFSIFYVILYKSYFQFKFYYMIHSDSVTPYVSFFKNKSNKHLSLSSKIDIDYHCLLTDKLYGI